MGCAAKFLLWLTILALVLGGVGYFVAYQVAFHGNDMAAWTATVFKQPELAVNLRKWSLTLKNLPPFNTMTEAQKTALPNEPQTAKPFNLGEWIQSGQSKEFFSTSRTALSNQDMWMTIIILAVAGLVIVTVVNLFRGKLSVSKFRDPLKGAFKDGATSLGSIGFISLLILVGLILQEAFLGGGWGLVAKAFTQFWWLWMLGFIIWAVIQKVGPDIGKYIVYGLVLLMTGVFLISLANGATMEDANVKIPLKGIGVFASGMYNNWMETTKTYFWLTIAGIGPYIIMPAFKKSSSSSSNGSKGK